jgi:RNA polymerase sigma-70 factor (ECF subfamily)
MTAAAQIETTFRQEHGRVLAALISQLGDFMLAEDALQDALANALERWAIDGVPRNPGAWLMTVARRRAIDYLRRTSTLERKAVLLDSLATQEEPDMDDAIPDERLKLMFTCCHPALALEAQVALTLHTLGGLSTPEVAAPSSSPCPPWPNGWRGHGVKSVTPASPFACRRPTCCPNGWTPCWPSFT